MIIKHNMPAMNAMRINGINTTQLADISEKLSTGYRINRAADDAAGLAISEKMRRQIRGLSQAALNAQDGISLVQIADGAMAEVHDMLHRGTELSVKAANGTLSDTEREYIQQEISQLQKEIDAVSDRTTFNEIQVLKGKDVPFVPKESDVVISGSLPAWIQSNALGNGYLSEKYTVPIEDPNNPGTFIDTDFPAAVLDFSALDADLTNKLKELDASGFYTTCCTCDNHYSINFTTDSSAPKQQTSGNHYIYNVDINGVASADDLMGRIMDVTNGHPNSHFTEFKIDNGKLYIHDNRPDVSPQSGKFGPGVARTKQDAMNQQPPVTIELQIGAEAGQHLSIELASVSCAALDIEWVDVSTVDGASDGINRFKHALEHISRERGRMGAYQNRLEHTIQNLENVVENTQAAEARIRDTDIADFMVQYSNANIIAQAGQAMLAQANQMNQGALQLIQGA